MRGAKLIGSTSLGNAKGQQATRDKDRRPEAFLERRKRHCLANHAEDVVRESFRVDVASRF